MKPSLLRIALALIFFALWGFRFLFPMLLLPEETSAKKNSNSGRISKPQSNGELIVQRACADDTRRDAQQNGDHSGNLNGNIHTASLFREKSRTRFALWILIFVGGFVCGLFVTLFGFVHRGTSALAQKVGSIPNSKID